MKLVISMEKQCLIPNLLDVFIFLFLVLMMQLLFYFKKKSLRVGSSTSEIKISFQKTKALVLPKIQRQLSCITELQETEQISFKCLWSNISEFGGHECICELCGTTDSKKIFSSLKILLHKISRI